MKKKFVDPEIVLIKLKVDDIMAESFGENETPWEDEL